MLDTVQAGVTVEIPMSCASETLGHLRHPHAIADDGQHGVVTLLHLAQLHEHSATFRPLGQMVGTCRTSTEHASAITRLRSDGHHQEQHNHTRAPRGIRTPNLRIKSPLLCH